MRVANADGRAVLVVGDGIVDIATASGGALPTDAQLLFERWDDVRALANRAQGPEEPFELSGWDGLWSLLTLITLRKCGHQTRHFRAACRDVRRSLRSR